MVAHDVSLERGAQRTKSKDLRARDEKAMAKFVIIYWQGTYLSVIEDGGRGRLL